jgi:hypothetical protein
MVERKTLLQQLIESCNSLFLDPKKLLRSGKQVALIRLQRKEQYCWQMAQTFLDNRDAHGIMDMGAELQALERARKEIEAIA